MTRIVISGTGLYTPPESISNEELVECFNTWATRFNTEHAAAIAEGTVDDVVRESGLTTYLVQGPKLDRVTAELTGKPGVEQVAPFGNSLHVVGSDPELLKSALAPLSDRSDIVVEPGETSLEDVFIKFMADSTDNMADNGVDA